MPDRHPIQDFFICDVTDAIPEDDMGSMEHPIYSLATQPDLAVREYEHNGVKVAIIPSALGLATIHDKDILIYEEDAEHNHMPDYAVALEGDQVRFTNRSMMKALPSPRQQPQYPRLDPETYHDARTGAPGYDVHFLEREWQSFWFESGQPELTNPDAAFIGFCRSRYTRKPNL